jgi:uncharacterized protein
MKKKPASMSENLKPAATKPVRTSKTDVASSVSEVKSIATEKPKRTRKPLLDTAIEAAKSFLRPARPPAAAAPISPAKPTAARKKKETLPESVKVPAILLEGDAPSTVQASGPGEKYSLGATPPAQSFSGGELPESYGTKKLFLTARDPHWLYAHWDLTRSQQQEFNGLSSDGHLVLRVFNGKVEGHPASEIHVHPESRHWFAHVEHAGHSYAAELGYYSELGKWVRVAVSSGTVTPPDAAATESDTEFATIPFDFPFAKLMQIIEEAVRDNVPLAKAIEELRRHGHPDLPRFSSSGVSSVPLSPSAACPAGMSNVAPGPVRVWTPEQERALARIINIDQTRRVWMGSLEITELIRRRLGPDVTSPVTTPSRPTSPVTAFGASGPLMPSGISSLGLVSNPLGGGVAAETAKGFWFNVNAELIIYGATEPNARVTLGGREVKLRPDGTFSFRFALPDGEYELSAVAVSADGTDGRAAELGFTRETQYLGDVGSTPQDPGLQPPLPDSI